VSGPPAEPSSFSVQPVATRAIMVATATAAPARLKGVAKFHLFNITP
jgi:hypothetical protein